MAFPSEPNPAGSPISTTEPALPESGISPARFSEPEPGTPPNDPESQPENFELAKDDPRAEVTDLAQKVPALFLRLAKFSPRLQDNNAPENVQLSREIHPNLSEDEATALIDQRREDLKTLQENILPTCAKKLNDLGRQIIAQSDNANSTTLARSIDLFEQYLVTENLYQDDVRQQRQFREEMKVLAEIKIKRMLESKECSSEDDLNSKISRKQKELYGSSTLPLWKIRAKRQEKTRIKDELQDLVNLRNRCYESRKELGTNLSAFNTEEVKAEFSTQGILRAIFAGTTNKLTETYNEITREVKANKSEFTIKTEDVDDLCREIVDNILTPQVEEKKRDWAESVAGGYTSQDQLDNISKNEPSLKELVKEVVRYQLEQYLKDTEKSDYRRTLSNFDYPEETKAKIEAFRNKPENYDLSTIFSDYVHIPIVGHLKGARDLFSNSQLYQTQRLLTSAMDALHQISQRTGGEAYWSLPHFITSSNPNSYEERQIGTNYYDQSWQNPYYKAFFDNPEIQSPKMAEMIGFTPESAGLARKIIGEAMTDGIIYDRMPGSGTETYNLAHNILRTRYTEGVPYAVIESLRTPNYLQDLQQYFSSLTPEEHDSLVKIPGFAKIIELSRQHEYAFDYSIENPIRQEFRQHLADRYFEGNLDGAEELIKKYFANPDEEIDWPVSWTEGTNRWGEKIYTNMKRMPVKRADVMLSIARDSGISLAKIRDEQVDNPVKAEINENVQLCANYLIENGTFAEAVFAFDSAPRRTIASIESKNKNLQTILRKSREIVDPRDREQLSKLLKWGIHDKDTVSAIVENLGGVLGESETSEPEMLNNIWMQAIENDLPIPDEYADKFAGKLDLGAEDFRTIGTTLIKIKQEKLFGESLFTNNADPKKWQDFALIAAKDYDLSVSILRQMLGNSPYGQLFNSELEYYGMVIENNEKIEEAIGMVKARSPEQDESSIRQKIFGFIEASRYNKNIEGALFFIRNAPKSIEQPSLFGFLLSRYDQFKAVPNPERNLDAYIELSQKLTASLSPEIKRLRDQLLDNLITAPTIEEAEQACREIIEIFEKNNLPYTAKVYLVFEAICAKTPETMDQKVQGAYSPILKETSHFQQRRSIIWNDLLRIHIDSGNPSLRQFIEILQSGERTLAKAESAGFDQLSVDEQQQLSYLLTKLEMIYGKSIQGQRDKRDHKTDINPATAIQQRYQDLRDSLRVREGQTVTDRVAEMFLKPLGLSSLDAALGRMRHAKTAATERNTGLYVREQENGGYLTLAAGDILKGVNPQYINLILQNGSVAKEFLGSDSSADSTWLDTDIGVVLPEDAEKGFGGAFSASPAAGYGDITLCVKQSRKIVPTEVARQQHDSYELFRTGVADSQRHYGIRTGFPTTEISAIIVNQSSIQNIDNLCFQIAQNGFYIPLADREGKILFSPEDYQNLRRTFNGIDRFDGAPIEFISSEELTIPDKAKESIMADQSAISHEKEAERPRTERLSAAVYETIQTVLSELGIKLKDKYDTGIVGAELTNTGSSGRDTNLAGDFDFDLMLMIDDTDFSHLPEMTSNLRKVFGGPDDSGSHADGNDYFLLKLNGVEKINDRTIAEILDITEQAERESLAKLDMDISIQRKTKVLEYGSQQAVEDRLSYIRTNFGAKAYNETINNILLAKKILKDGNAYNKKEHGGFGGIGVENWILFHNGNLVEAFVGFAKASHDEKSEVIGFGQFQHEYRIYDPGINLKYGSHDNFIRSMKEEGYIKMAKTVSAWLDEKGIEWRNIAS